MKTDTKKQKVLVGLSGGVDSAVAALLLKKQGHNVIGAFMINFSEIKNKITGDCNYLEDKKDAQKIAAILNIPLKILNFEKEYKKHVINPMFKDYARGLTPNPDSLCNKTIKFPLLWKEAKKLKCDYIATGHHIKKTYDKKNYRYSLQIPKDKNKDQSYFLYELTQPDLQHTLFPIGEASLTKQEVRQIANLHGFPNYKKKGTKGICFVGKINMKSFLQQKIKPKKGNILDPKGNIIGTHQGIMFYTIGERVGPRSGFKIDNKYRNKIGKKLYIEKKNIKTNAITVASQGHQSLLKSQFYIIKTNFINNKPKYPLNNIKVRIRHLGELIPATITRKNKKIRCELLKSIQGLADGQSAVIYKGKTVLGGGEIRNS